MSNPAKAFGKFVLSGCKQVPEEVYNQRLAICEACPKWKTYLGGVCGHCGCITRIKLRLPDERCPLAKPKWNRV